MKLVVFSLMILTLSPVAGRAGDGQHDFDFFFGAWKVHLRRLAHPLSGSNSWVEYDGTALTRKVWDGRANLEEFEASNPATHASIEGLTLRLYDPRSHQWRLYWATSNDGALGQPMIGQFKDGRGEFFDQELFEGKAIFVRYVWSDITAGACRFEQSFSADGGKTWEPNWIATFVRAQQAKVDGPAAAVDSGFHGFDFELGTWKIHLSRLQQPLTGSTAWVQFDGDSVTRKVWNGRADLEEFETEGSAGHIEGLALRLYNPHSRQWSIHWATSKDGILGQPTIGEFKAGRGEFYDQEVFKGRVILVRFIWSEITPNSAHFEQSFSNDGGQTWEVNWITNQKRINDETDTTH